MAIKKAFLKYPAIIICSLLAMPYASAESVLRVACKGEASGSKVYINGKSYGDCPVDIFLAAGKVNVRVVKTVDAQHERVFEKTLTLMDNIPKKITVVLSASQLTAQALQAQAKEALTQARAGDIAAMKKLSSLYDKGLGLPVSAEKAKFWKNKAVETQNKASAQAVLKQAESGNIAAMQTMAKLYSKGKGVKQSDAQARHWQKQHDQAVSQKKHKEAMQVLAQAESGDIAAMRKIAQRYRTGDGVEKSEAKASEWDNKAKISKNKKQQQQQAQAEKEAIKAKLEDYESGKVYLDSFIASGKLVGLDTAKGSEGASSILTFSPTVLVVTAIGIASDLVSAPFHATTHVKLQHDLNARAAVWDKPSSMVAKAYKQQPAPE